MSDFGVISGESGYIHTKRRYTEFVPKVTWDDVIQAIETSYKRQMDEKVPTHRTYTSFHVLRGSEKSGPYMQIFDPVRRASITNASREVLNSEPRIINMDIYMNLSSVSSANGRHKDDHDVLIVQAIGTTLYKFDDGYDAIMVPGDSLYIPARVYHEPIPLCPRVNLSFGLKPQ